MKVITREALAVRLDQLAEQNTLIAPRDVDGILLYAPVVQSSEIVFEYSRPKMSAKEAVFPSTQRILTIEKNGKETTLLESKMDKPQIVFGVRPCDARGFSVLDAVFLGRAPADANYARRREATTLIGLACQKMWDGCFCNSVGGAPDDDKHVDVMLTQVDGGYAIRAITEKGNALIANWEAKEIAVEPARPALNAAEPSVNEKELPAHFRDAYWDLLGERCLSCRTCGYVCPTCRCFDVRDQVVERRANHAEYERIRCWDSCTSTNYRVVAGGHNPRSVKGQRIRNRMFCKFYYLAQDYQTDGCVGCGRCIESCPVNIDIVEVMRDLAQAEVKQ